MSISVWTSRLNSTKTHTSLEVTCVVLTDFTKGTSLEVTCVDRVTQTSLEVTHVDRVTHTSLEMTHVDRVTYFTKGNVC